MARIYISVVVIIASVLIVGVIPAQDELTLRPTRVEVDSNFDGAVDRIEHYKAGQIDRVENDTDFDGAYDEWVYYQDGMVDRAEKDTNADGKPDTWIEY